MAIFHLVLSSPSWVGLCPGLLLMVVVVVVVVVVPAWHPSPRDIMRGLLQCCTVMQ